MKKDMLPMEILIMNIDTATIPELMEILKVNRKRKGISIEEAAYMCNVTGQTVRNTENGVTLNGDVFLYELLLLNDDQLIMDIIKRMVAIKKAP